MGQLKIACFSLASITLHRMVLNYLSNNYSSHTLPFHLQSSHIALLSVSQAHLIYSGFIVLAFHSLDVVCVYCLQCLFPEHPTPIDGGCTIYSASTVITWSTPAYMCLIRSFRLLDICCSSDPITTMPEI